GITLPIDGGATAGTKGSPVPPSEPARGSETAVNRHCEPTGHANARPMTGSAKQSTAARKTGLLRRGVYHRARRRRDPLAPRNDGPIEPCLSLLRPHTRNAFLYSQDSRDGHPGAGNFLDLAGGARAVI